MPAGVTATTEGETWVKGPKGTLRCRCAKRSRYEICDEGTASAGDYTKQARAFWGMQRTLVQNFVTGVSEGFTKVLEITGVGYRAQAQGRNLPPAARL